MATATIKRGYAPSKPKPVSYMVRKGYTDQHIARFKAKTGKFKQNHKTESGSGLQEPKSGINNTNNDGVITEDT